MPPVDLEAFVSVCGSSSSSSARKIACEPLDGHNHAAAAAEKPPESFWLSKDAECDWFNRNAFLERKESTKGNGANSNHTNSSSHRFSFNLKSKAAMIGLPKTQKNNFCDKRRCKPLKIRLFPPKRSESVGKSMAQMTEPSSPKVSCMGRVRSKRSRRRKPEKKPAKAAERTESERGETRIGLCSNLSSLFRSDRRRRDGSVVKIEDSSVKSSYSKTKTSNRSENIPTGNEAAIETPGLGGMTRFVSGRRTRSWGAEEGEGARRSIDSERSVTLGRCESTRLN